MDGSCPVKGDYRLFTDWRPRCSTQYYDMISNNLPSALEYRMYLTHNAQSLMMNNAQSAYNKSVCGPCVDKPSWNDGTMLKELDTQTCNSRTCSFRMNDINGLGRQRLYADEPEIRKEFIREKEKENAFFKTQQ